MGLTIVTGFALCGCNIVGPAFYFVHGPPKTPAQFELDPERPTLVFVDDSNSAIGRRRDRMQIASSAERLLKEKGLVEQLRPCGSAVTIVMRESSTDPMSIVEIGRAVDAEVVVYATLDRFTISPDGASIEPAADIRVKVLDAVSGDRLFPTGEQEWFRKSVSLPRRLGLSDRTLSQQSRIRNELAERVGEELGLIFVEHETRRSESRVGES